MNRKDKRTIQEQVYDDLIAPVLGDNTILITVKYTRRGEHILVGSNLPFTKMHRILDEAASIVFEKIREEDKATGKRGPGRPKGSKNKVKRGPGRPKGSKNKVKK